MRLFAGLLAVVFFLIAWIILTLIVIKNGRNNGDIFVNLFFLLGVISFTIYSVQVGEILFILLNGIASILAFINFYYIPNKFKKMKKEIKSIEMEISDNKE